MSQRPPLPTHTQTSNSPCRQQLVCTQPSPDGLLGRPGISLARENGYQHLTSRLAARLSQFNVADAQQSSQLPDAIDIDSLLELFEGQARGSSSSVTNVEAPDTKPNRFMSTLTKSLDDLVDQLQQAGDTQRERNSRQNDQIERITAGLANTEATIDSWAKLMFNSGSSNENGA
ncbi:hypothetical protein K456DRAFT_59751, partial [Colletotrichum gloeosporioides 23]